MVNTESQPSNPAICLQVLDNQVIIAKDSSKSFTFDQIFEETVQQQGIYDQNCKPLIEQFLNGFNSTIFA